MSVSPNLRLDPAARAGARQRLRRTCSRTVLPSQAAIADLIGAARSLLFPCVDEEDVVWGESFEQRMDFLRSGLTMQVGRALAHAGVRDRMEGSAGEIVAQVMEQLPEVQGLLESDLHAAFDGDPSLVHVEEAEVCFPGIFALLCQRLAHRLYRVGVPLIPRMMTEYAHSKTGIDIHPGASIGERMFIDHGTGVVIGETAVLGNRVRLYQGVTLGAKSLPADDSGRLVKGRPRHPILEDDVVVYSGASILGRITIGRGAVIAGNTWVTRDVAPGSVVRQAPPRSELFSHGGGI